MDVFRAEDFYILFEGISHRTREQNVEELQRVEIMDVFRAGNFYITSESLILQTREQNVEEHQRVS